MSEVKSAREIWSELQSDPRFAVETIESDRRAIIEKCKEAIRSMSTGGLIGEDEAIAILDSAFAEIEGGK